MGVTGKVPEAVRVAVSEIIGVEGFVAGVSLADGIEDSAGAGELLSDGVDDSAGSGVPLPEGVEVSAGPGVLLSADFGMAV